MSQDNAIQSEFDVFLKAEPFGARESVPEIILETLEKFGSCPSDSYMSHHTAVHEGVWPSSNRTQRLVCIRDRPR